ncbi:TIGR00341 family protein [Patescibacteria group bacterium]|nr:TIGR00341 family protein [Patescibacteria group bacterium]MBU1673786.1 TIGR00341 family protein [Patescibacteria group bacterium]MBU1964126.1 TIGR00341 family protein [Patescibacteria group bacterium]
MEKKQNNHKSKTHPIRKIVRKIFDPASLEEQSAIDARIREQAKDTPSFYILTIVSIVIITVGLIINNSVVVIGGMIIAPVIWPLLSLSVSIIHGHKKMLRASIFTVIKTFAVILLISFLIGLVTPLYDLSDEILVRTGPTVFNLIIALAAGFGAAFATVYASRSATIFGVAIAVALVPPLCVLGILLADGRFDLVGGALLLFLTNFIAIIIASMSVFALARFSGPHTKPGEERKTKAIIYTISAFTVICILLGYLTYNAIVITKVQSLTYDTFEENFTDEQLVNVEVNQGKYSYNIRGTIYGPDEILEDEIDKFTASLSQKVERPVSVDLNVVKIEKAISFSDY